MKTKRSQKTEGVLSSNAKNDTKTDVIAQFWEKYETADYVNRIILLQSLPPIKELRHKFLPDHKHYAAETFMTYLDDYKKYLENKK